MKFGYGHAGVELGRRIVVQPQVNDAYMYFHLYLNIHVMHSCRQGDRE